MSLINVNGQPVTSEVPASATPEAAAPAQRVQLTPQQVQQIIGAYQRLKELSAANITTPKEDAEKQGLINFLHASLLQHAEEFFGCWVAINQEYTPLINGFTALLRRALTRIDASNQANQVQAVETADKPAA